MGKQKRTSRKAVRLDRIGWREWLALPELGIDAIKAKIDTGARSSVLHAYDVEPYRDGGKRMVRFKIHPYQRNYRFSVAATAEVIDRRWVRSSSGHRTYRPVIATPVHLGPMTWMVELTLTNRDEMGFRMLLGRSALRRRFLIDPGQSYLHGRDLEHIQALYIEPSEPSEDES